MHLLLTYELFVGRMSWCHGVTGEPTMLNQHWILSTAPVPHGPVWAVFKYKGTSIPFYVPSLFYLQGLWLFFSVTAEKMKESKSPRRQNRLGA